MPDSAETSPWRTDRYLTSETDHHLTIYDEADPEGWVASTVWLEVADNE